MSIPVDVLIIGAGVQGLLLLRRLVQDYSVVVVGTDLRASETLHAHGYFASGWNAENVEAARTYRQAASWWREFLLRHQVNPSENAVYRALPQRALDRMRATWDDASIQFRPAALPAPFDLSAWPSQRVIHFPDDVVFDAAAAVTELKHPFAHHVIEGTFASARIEQGAIAEVTVNTSSGPQTFAPGYVLAAAGAGNASLLTSLDVPEMEVRQSQLARPRHMVCARGATLPNVSVFANELTLIAHPERDGRVTWLVTYDPPKLRFMRGPLNMAHDPDVLAGVVCATLSRLMALIPGFEAIAAQCEWDVYAGWKTDAPGHDAKAVLRISHLKPYEVRSFGLTNFLAAWPNHWGLAAPAAMDAATVVRETLVQRFDQPAPLRLPPADADATRMKWLRADRPWQRWAQFVDRYGFDCDVAD